MKSNYQNVLKLFKEPYSVESKVFFFFFPRQFFLSSAFEFYISVAVTGGNSSLLHPRTVELGRAFLSGLWLCLHNLTLIVVAADITTGDRGLC